MGGEVNGVVEQSASRGAGGHSAAAGAGVDFRLVHGMRKRVGIICVVGKKLDVDIEGDEKSFIFGTKDAAEEGASGLLLQRENILLAAAGVEKNAERQGLIGFRSEVFDGLRRLVFKDVEVILGEVGDEQPVL